MRASIDELAQPGPGPAEQPTFDQCRRAAREVRRAEYGALALDVMRPPGAFGVVRARAPLSIGLYVAAAEGLLVWRGPQAFAVLHRNPAVGAPPRPGSARLRLLRALDRHWEGLVFATPPMVALLCAVAIVGVVGRSGLAVLAALALAVGAMAWVCAVMTVGIMFYAVRRLRSIGAAAATTTSAADSLVSWHWSLPLLHVSDPAEVDGLLRRVLSRFTKLIVAEGTQAAAQAGLRVAAGTPTQTLVIVLRGVTTEAARRQVRLGYERFTPFDGEPVQPDVVVALSLGRASPRRPPVASGDFLLLYVMAAATALAITGLFVAQWEAAACLGEECARRPATYATSLRWLAQRLWLTDPPGVSPATAGGVIVGWLTSAIGVTGLLVAVVAVRQTWRRHRHVQVAYEQGLTPIMKRTRVLLVVVTDVEHDAVLAAVRRANGIQGRRHYADHHTVFDLGAISETDVLLAQVLTQGPLGPGGAMLSTDGVIRSCDPDYLIMVGICYGLFEDEQRIGDILIADRVQEVDHRKAVDGADGEVEFIHRGESVSPSVLLLDRCRAAVTDWPGARVHTGLLLAGATLVDSRAYRKRLKSRFPHAIGGEMEGAGVYAAAAKAGKQWIVVKAISDMGMDKTEDYQQVAAGNAAEFIVHMLQMGALD